MILDFEYKHADLPSTLIRLQNLGLRSMLLARIQVDNYINLEWDFTGFASLKKLTITRGWFPSPSHMFDIMLKFKSVEHLRIIQPCFNRTVSTISMSDRKLPVSRNSTVPLWRILELHFWALAYETFAWLTMQPDLPVLQNIAITGLYAEDFASAGKFLQSLGPRLNYLELQLPTTPLSKSICISCIA
jgi:hypothetical protein